MSQSEQPTWCRRRAGSPPLPMHDRDGNVVMSDCAVPIRLRPTNTVDDAGRAVWFVPDGATSPGDVIEFGPIPDDVVIVFGGSTVSGWAVA